MPLTTATYALACHARFFRTGQAYTVPSSGTCGRESKPGADDPDWIDLGVIESWEASITDEEEKAVWAPVPGHLVKKDIITTKQGLQYKFTTNELTPFALEAFFRATQELDDESTQFNPLSAVPRTGWLKLLKYSQDDAQILSLDIFCRIKVTGGMKGGNGELIMPEFTADVLYSTLNTAGL